MDEQKQRTKKNIIHSITWIMVAIYKLGLINT